MKETLSNFFRRAKMRSAVAGSILLLALLLGSLHSNSAGQTDTLTGHLLVASPDMRDPRFTEAVIYIVKHDNSGTLGLVINRPLAKGPIEDLLKSFGADSEGAKGEIVVHYGGPLNPGDGFILHTDDILLDSSTRIKDGIAVTSDSRLVQDLAHGKGPSQWLFMFGYAGWAPGQLETELKGNAWFVVGADQALIFGKEATSKWRQAMDRRQFKL